MRQIRQRARVDSHLNDVRTGAKKKIDWGKWIYLGIVGCIFTWVANLFFGHMIIFSADGLVMRDRMAVEASFTARLEAVNVDSGDTVRAGDVIAVSVSQEIIDKLVQMTREIGDIDTRIADLQARRVTLDRLLPTARLQRAETGKILASYEQLSARRLIAASRVSEQRAAVYQTQAALDAMDVERETIGGRMAALIAARDALLAARAAVEKSYNGGLIVAGAGGIVGPKAARSGQVVATGDPILDLFVGEPYVLAYLSSSTVYTVEPGDRVSLSSGFHKATGTIRQIQPVADTLPVEFQKVFQPQDRGIVALVTIDGAADGAVPFPLFAKVTIGWESWLPDWETPGWMAQGIAAATTFGTTLLSRMQADPDA